MIEFNKIVVGCIVECTPNCIIGEVLFLIKNEKTTVCVLLKDRKESIFVPAKDCRILYIKYSGKYFDVNGNEMPEDFDWSV